MSLWATQVLPRLMDRVMALAPYAKLREQVCAGLTGEVVEIGFGSGANLPYLPDGVRRLWAVEPSAVAIRLATGRRAAAGVPVEVCGLDGQRLELPDASVDAALCTFTLCTIPDPVAAAAELRRVLRRGGRLHFLEHGTAPEAGVRRWQQRLDGVQQRLAGGCHLTRDPAAILTGAGLRVEQLERSYVAGVPRVLGALHRGVAVA